MKILLLEDEPLARQRMAQLLASHCPQHQLIAQFDSLEACREWLKTGHQADLLLADIQLGDGLSLDFFQEVAWEIPIIFTTAFDEYSLRAFKLNSIDYLLKPIKAVELVAALEKREKQLQQAAPPPIDYIRLAQLLKQGEHSYQKRLLVRYGQHLKAIDTDDIAYIFVESRAVLLQTFDQQHLPLDYQLDALEEMLDPGKFFRINRKIITSFKAIKRMHSYSRSRIQLELDPPTKIDAVVSTERTPAFKKWLEGHN